MIAERIQEMVKSAIAILNIDGIRCALGLDKKLRNRDKHRDQLS